MKTVWDKNDPNNKEHMVDIKEATLHLRTKVASRVAFFFNKKLEYFLNNYKQTKLSKGIKDVMKTVSVSSIFHQHGLNVKKKYISIFF